MQVRKRPRGPLPLTNKGQLSLFFVGTGSAFSKTLFQNNLLIIKGNDHLMIDCGTRTPVALHNLGVSTGTISDFLITHSHADHVGGLEEVMLKNRYVHRRKPRIHIPLAYELELWEHTLRGGSEANERHNGNGLRFSDFWEVVRPAALPDTTRDMREVVAGSINVKMFRTCHYPEQAKDWKESAYSVGLVIDDRVLFTGDTQYDPTLISELDEAFPIETIFHDVQFFTGGIHASLDEVLQLPESILSRTLLMHYPDSYQDNTRRVKEAGLSFTRQWYFYDFDQR